MSIQLAENAPIILSQEIERYFDRLWPLLRSLTGEGVRATHDILAEIAPLERIEVPSGTQVFDWTVPKEWRVGQAFIVRPDGQRIADVRENNLHLVNYSVPFRGKLPLSELQKHLFSLPDKPRAVPYVTSYYKPEWGFCLSHEERQALPDGMYEAVVDTELFDGSLTISEAILPGRTENEVLLSTYTCHPSLANNELSGPLVTAFLYRNIASWPDRRLTYRFVFLPETIGSIAYLSLRGELLKERMLAGYVVNCIGDPGAFTYKYSRQGNAMADRAAEYILKKLPAVKFVPFFPTGSDERQYCSPGFDLPVGSIMRSMYGTYDEYHTSLDNRNFTSFAALAESVDVYTQVCAALDMNAAYVNQSPFGEPQLGKRGLYPQLGTGTTSTDTQALLWLLNFSDGKHDLLDIAGRSGADIAALHKNARRCLEQGLLKEIDV